MLRSFEFRIAIFAVSCLETGFQWQSGLKVALWLTQREWMAVFGGDDDVTNQ